MSAKIAKHRNRFFIFLKKKFYDWDTVVSYVANVVKIQKAFTLCVMD